MAESFTRSACLAKTLRWIAATSASRSVFCCRRKPGVVPGSCANHVPHSSTASQMRFCGSYLSITAVWRVMRSSMRHACASVSAQPASSKSVAEARGGQPPPGMV